MMRRMRARVRYFVTHWWNRATGTPNAILHRMLVREEQR